jgi:hypothetical protein
VAINTNTSHVYALGGVGVDNRRVSTPTPAHLPLPTEIVKTEVQETDDFGTWETTYTVCTPVSSGCPAATANAAALGFASVQTAIGIEDTVTLTSPPGGLDVVYLIFNDSDGVPEPNTFLLLATALAGGGLLPRCSALRP